jgi:hypothetical protein
MMTRHIIAVFCSVLLVAQADGAPAPAKGPQEALLEIAAGAPVEVKLATGTKLRGRLEQVRNGSFDVRVAGKDQLETRSFAFSEVKSVKPIKESGAGKVALYMLAGAGAFVLFLYGLAFAVAD